MKKIPNSSITATNLMRAFYGGQNLRVINVTVHLSSVTLERSKALQSVSDGKMADDSSSRTEERILRIKCSRKKTATRFFESESFAFCFPAITKLKLNYYTWDHNTAQYLDRFDFSQLKKLTLTDVNVFDFLRAVPAQHLANLESLKIHLGVEFYGDELLNSFRARHRDLVDKLFDEVKLLKKLDISFFNWSQYFPPMAVTKLGALQTLRLTTLESDLEDEPVSLETFTSINLCCPELRELTMSLRTDLGEVSYPCFGSFWLAPVLSSRTARWDISTYHIC